MTSRVFLLLALVLAGCATAPTAGQIVRTLTPETMSIGVTAPNLFAGPVASTKGNNESRRDSVGVIGGTVTFTYRLKPIRIERAEVQPVRIVKTPPMTSTPTPKPDPYGNP